MRLGLHKDHGISGWKLLFCGLLLGCSRTPVSPPSSDLPAGALARVGSWSIAPATLDLIRLAPESVWPAVSHDALFAEQLEETAPDAARVVRRGVLVRALSGGLQARALSDHGEPRASELARESAKLWLEVDRPRSVRTVDLLIPTESLAPDDEAYALAQRIEEKVRGQHTLEEFSMLARGVDFGAFDVQFFFRAPTTADGRAVILGAEDQQYAPLAPECARAAAALSDVGEVSPIVGSHEGFHLLIATEILPAFRLPEEQRLERLRNEVAATRATAEWNELREQLRKATPVSVVPQHSAWTRLVWQER